MNAEWLRYYIAAKLNANVEDIDFNPDDFVARVNSDLIGKYVNIASRAANFITKHFRGGLEYAGDKAALTRAARASAALVRESYEAREFGKAMRDVMALADRINQEFDARQPWVLAKDPAKAAKVHDAVIAQHRALRAWHGANDAKLKALGGQLARAAGDIARGRYERLVRNKGENVVVGVQHGVCGGCHMRVPPQLLVTCQGQQEIVTCSNCGRILYYSPDMDLAVAE